MTNDTIRESVASSDIASRITQDANVSIEPQTPQVEERSSCGDGIYAPHRWSHQVRTHMTPILGFAEILTEQLDDPAHSAAAHTIKRHGEQLLEILNSLAVAAPLSNQICNTQSGDLRKDVQEEGLAT